MNGDRPPPHPRPAGPVPASTEPSQVLRRRPRPAPPAAPQPAAAAPFNAWPRTPETLRRPRRATPRKAAGSGKRRWPRFLALVLFGTVVLTVVASIGVGWWLETSLRREAALPDYPDRPAAGAGTNWLLVGSDSRQDLNGEQQRELSTGGDVGNSRTDTILLVHVPGFGSANPTTLVSIPRDSYVPIPGHGKDKINAAFALGGAPLLAQTVEQATGLHLDHFAEVGFAGFANVVDALGGVTLCPTEPIDDPLAGIDLPAGCQHLDGRNALGFVRTRATPRADLDRMINQRRFVSAVLHRALSPAVWLNPWRWYSVPHAAVGALTVDLGGHVWDLARLGWELHSSPLAITVPIGEFTSSDVGSVVVWDHDAAGALFAALGSDDPVPAAVLQTQP